MHGYHILYNIIPEGWSQIIGPGMIMWHREAIYRLDTGLGTCLVQKLYVTGLPWLQVHRGVMDPQMRADQ